MNGAVPALKVFLIEDHSLVRGGLSRLIQASKMEVAGEASCIAEAIPKITSSQPNVVSLDLMLPGLSGKDALMELLKQHPGLRVLVVSARTQGPEIQGLLRLGALGYVTKGASSEVYVGALQSVAEGRSFLCPDSANSLAQGIRSVNESPLPRLTPRLLQVLSCISRGMKTKEIGEALFLSPKTIEKYRGQILRKLSARNQIEALQKARELGLLEA